MKRTHWLSIGFLVCALLAIFITSNQSTAQEGDPTPTPAFSYINVEAARVRAAPNETALSIGTLLRDARVTPYNRDETGDWVLVEYAQSFGWIRRDLAVWVENIDTLPILMTNSLTPTPAPRTPSATPRLVTLTPVGSYIIARVNVYVRTGPGLSFIPLGILTPGSVVEPLNIDETGTWVLVRYTYNQREEGVTATRVVDGFGWVTRNVVLWTIDINELPILYDDALTPTLTFTPSFTPSATPSETISPTVTASPSPTNTDIPTETPSATVTNTEILTELPSATVTNTDIPTETPSATVTNTDIPTQTPNPTSTNTEFPTETPNPTSTNTETPTELPSATVTNTDIPTETPNPTSTNTDIPTEFPTNTDIPSETPAEMTMAVVMNTDIPTETPTNTEISSETPTITDAPTETPNPTSTNTDIPTETPQPTITNTPTLSGNATAIEELTPLPTSEITPEVAIAQTLTETPLVSVNVDEPPTSSASLPIEAILAGFVLFFIILYVLMYWRGQAAIDRYANGFVIDTCPVCRTGHLEVETRIVRWFGIPRPRRTVRCDNCRSLLRETGAHRWRYAVDKLANLAMYDRYNGLEVDERTLQKLSENPIRSSGDE